jgi:hypothetical protein
MRSLDEVIGRLYEAFSTFEMNAEALHRKRLSNAFWELPCPAHDAVVAWFFSDEIAKIPSGAYGCDLTRAD